MLLCRTLCQRLEPVSIVGDTHLHRPFLHTVSNSVGNAAVQTGTVVYHVNHLLVDIRGQVTEHLLFVEDILTEILRWSLFRYGNIEGSLLESLLHNLKSHIVCHISL